MKTDLIKNTPRLLDEIGLSLECLRHCSITVASMSLDDDGDCGPACTEVLEPSVEILHLTEVQ